MIRGKNIRKLLVIFLVLLNIISIITLLQSRGFYPSFQSKSQFICSIFHRYASGGDRCIYRSQLYPETFESNSNHQSESYTDNFNMTIGWVDEKAISRIISEFNDQRQEEIKGQLAFDVTDENQQKYHNSVDIFSPEFIRPHHRIPMKVPSNSNNRTRNVSEIELESEKAADRNPISIHVFAWKRSKSLYRLLKSIADADYGGKNNIPLIIHVDGGYTTVVENLVDSYEWRHGVKTVIKSQRNKGLQELMISAWTPSTSKKEFAIFLEDDIQVSPLYFEYASWCARTFFSHSTESESALNSAIIGCSLYTPRLNEISPTKDPQNPPTWSPSMILPNTTRLFYFQLPCSWGALYDGGAWAGFQKFYYKRKTDANFPPIPLSRSNAWKHSWKRFLIEFMYLKGLLLVYPSFPFESSFSTNYYEDGIHSVKDGDEPIVKDFLRVEPDSRFQVPLLTRSDSKMVWDGILSLDRSKIKAYGVEIPIVSLEHVVWDDGGMEGLARRGDTFSKKFSLGI